MLIMPRYNKDIRHIITREEAEEMIRKAKRLRDAFIVAVLYITGRFHRSNFVHNWSKTKRNFAVEERRYLDQEEVGSY